MNSDDASLIHTVATLSIDSSPDFATIFESFSLLNSESSNSDILKAIVTVRHILASEDSTHLETNISICINLGLIPKLIDYLKTWVLTNIACSSEPDHIQALIDSGILAALASCMVHSTDANVKDQCCWGLGNIAGEDAQCAGLFLESDYIKAIAFTVNCFIEVGDWEALSNAVWTVMNIFRWKLFDDLEVYIPVVSACHNILPLLDSLLRNDYISLVESFLWIFAFLAEQFETVYDLFITKEMAFCFATLIHHSNNTISYVAFRFLGNLFTGWCPFVVEILDKLGLVRSLFSMLENSTNIFHKKEVLWFFNNVISDSQESLQFCFDKDIIPVVIKYLTHGEHSLFMESGFCILNTINDCSYEQLIFWLKKVCLLLLFKGCQDLIKELLVILSVF
ncbi:hypothetical protein GEMRC1_003062 [Eukaryota sp. GEM-RC1]